MPNKRSNSRRRPGGQRPIQRRPPQRPVGAEAPASDSAPPEATSPPPAVQMQLGKPAAAAVAPARPAAGPAPSAARRTQAQRRGARPRGPRGLQIGDTNPAIPLEKVPYFTSDLVRLAITAVVMIALLVVGAKLIIPHFLT